MSRTPLFYARSIPTARYLLEAGARLEWSDGHNTPISYMQAFYDQESAAVAQFLEDELIKQTIGKKLLQKRQPATRASIREALENRSKIRKTAPADTHEPEQCPVCLDDLTGGDFLQTFGCSHSCHEECFQSMLQQGYTEWLCCNPLAGSKAVKAQVTSDTTESDALLALRLAADEPLDLLDEQRGQQEIHWV